MGSPRISILKALSETLHQRHQLKRKQTTFYRVQGEFLQSVRIDEGSRNGIGSYRYSAAYFISYLPELKVIQNTDGAIDPTQFCAFEHGQLGAWRTESDPGLIADRIAAAVESVAIPAFHEFSSLHKYSEIENAATDPESVQFHSFKRRAMAGEFSSVLEEIDRFLDETSEPLRSVWLRGAVRRLYPYLKRKCQELNQSPTMR